MTDTELLRQYAQEGSQEAFTQLVRQHVDVVYSAARRQARGDAHLAEEITQQVFILLAQKAKTLSDDVLLGGWLYNAVRFIARDQLRKVENRSHHEQKAAAMADELRNAAANGGKRDAWTDAEEILDDVLEKLDAPTRGLIVLRYFEGKTAGEVAARLNISEDAARKRVNRAVEQLRDLFARRGVVMSATALAESLAAKTIIHAPAHLAASAASAAMSSAVGASSGAAASSAGAVKTGAVLMAAKGNLIAASIIGAICLTGAVVGGVKAVRHFSDTEPTSPGAVRMVRVAPAAPVGPVFTGVIRDPAGQPLAGAQVNIVAQGMSLNIYPATASPAAATDSSARARSAANLRAIGQAILMYSATGNPNLSTITRADGSFSLPKPPRHFEIVVRSPQGFAQISGETLAKSADITAAPWGSIAGRVMGGTKPLANATVYTFELPAPYGFTTVMRQTQLRTDAAGNFVLPRAAPGEVRLALADPVTHRFTRWVYGVVDPGKQTTLNIGGVGRPVVGRLIPDPAANPPLPSLQWNYQSKTLLPNAFFRRENAFLAPAPIHPAGETLEQYRAIEETFGKTKEGVALKLAEVGQLDCRINPDGTFRIEDVPAGDWHFKASLAGVTSDINYVEDVARAEIDFTVDPMPGDRSDQPLQLGDIKMIAPHYLHPGDLATPFHFTTLDGVTHSTADYKGKHLLIVLATSLDWAKPLLDPFKSLANQCQNEPRVQFVWLMLATPEEAAKAAKDFALPGLVASCLNSDIPPEYAATIPAGILIDPAGKLVQKHMMDASACAKIVRNALPPVK